MIIFNKFKIAACTRFMETCFHPCNAVFSRSVHGRIVSKRGSLYDVLDIPYSATQAEIKSAYYELSLKYHPDLNKTQEAEKVFKELTEAYSVLGDLNSRRDYDKEIGAYFTLRSTKKKETSEKVLRLTDEMLEIDMSGIQESGVFLSTIATLSTVLSTPVRLMNVSISNGGIQSHDMRVLQLLRKICNGTLAANVGLSAVTYIPGEPLGGNFSAEAGRLGSYYPFWEGKVCIESLPVYNLSPINLTESGTVIKVTGWAFVGGDKPIRVAQVMSKEVHRLLKIKLPDISVNISSRRDRNSRCEGIGQGVMLLAEMSSGLVLSGTALWKKGMTPEQVVDEAVRILLFNIRSGTCVDNMLQDQAILFMSLASGKSSLRVSPLNKRSRTVIEAIETFTEVRFNISESGRTNDEKTGKSVLIECDGQGCVNKDFLPPIDNRDSVECTV